MINDKYYCVVLRGDLYVMEERSMNNLTEECRYFRDNAEEALEIVYRLNGL